MDTSSGLSDILSSLIQNPEVMKAVSSITNEASKKDEAPPAEKKAEGSDTGEFSIPPELLAKLPQMMSALSGSSSLLSAVGGEKKEDGSHSQGQRKELLRALKPFLSEKRCAVIDGLLQFEGLAGVLSAFQNK
ncbi:MAG: hypothetical protein IJF69_00735 [Clostridia bacterium]|nr:hypothetical protein [Clostridia bacterium]